MPDQIFRGGTPWPHMQATDASGAENPYSDAWDGMLGVGPQIVAPEPALTLMDLDRVVAHKLSVASRQAEVDKRKACRVAWDEGFAAAHRAGFNAGAEAVYQQIRPVAADCRSYGEALKEHLETRGSTIKREREFIAWAAGVVLGMAERLRKVNADA